MNAVTRMCGALAIVAGLLSAKGCAKAPKLGEPLEGLTPEQHDQFKRGRAEFERVFTPKTGLGPLFNANACSECHESPVSGGSGDEIEIHVSKLLLESSTCDPLVQKGGPVIQQMATAALKAALRIHAEPVPLEADAIARRTTPTIFGLGLLDAVPDATILGLADPEDRNGDGISGRPNRFFDGRLGRFGRKALVPTLREFNDGAFLVEQGITNPALPTEETVGGQPIPAGVDPVSEPEITQETIDLADAFVRFLAPPAPKKLTPAGRRGREIFSEIGCSGCHVPVLKTAEHPIKALNHRELAAYTDLLLHDMGPESADICFGLAVRSEFRTEPLMGLGVRTQIEKEGPRLLHDGRARSIAEAISLHGGEGSNARDKFHALSETDRQALLEFLTSL